MLKQLKTIKTIVIWITVMGLLVACGNAQSTPETQPVATNAPIVPTTSNTTDSSAYPAPDANSAYPGTETSVNSAGEEFLAEPPNPDREMPATSPDLGAIGGILIREQSNQGFLPLDPHELVLAEVITSDTGQPALVGYDEASPRGETFPTGVFVFRNVKPGQYSLVINMAVTEFLVKDATTGAELIFTVTANEVTDLGQVIVQLP
jgi:hypothetical protein